MLFHFRAVPLILDMNESIESMIVIDEWKEKHSQTDQNSTPGEVIKKKLLAMELDQDGQIAIQEGQTSDILENNCTLYDSKNHISIAREEKKPQNESMEKLFKCSICENEYAKIEELAEHISSVHEEKNPIDWMVMPPKGQLISE